MWGSSLSSYSSNPFKLRHGKPRKVGQTMLLAEFSIWPMDKGESVSPYVARALDIVDRSGLPYKLGPLGTCIEGEWAEVMAVIQKCYEALATDCNRITCTVKMDW